MSAAEVRLPAVRSAALARAEQVGMRLRADRVVFWDHRKLGGS